MRPDTARSIADEMVEEVGTVEALRHMAQVVRQADSWREFRNAMAIVWAILV